MQSNDIDFLDLLNGQVQYVVPRWQRRYRWGRSDIERLVQDLLAVAAAGEESAHYGGTLLTFLEPGPAGVVKTIRVVDGQQRLTTVSILLACIAEKLGPHGQCGEWTAQIIRDDRLTNPGKAQEKHRKLRLQYGDEEEYNRGLKAEPSGSGAVTQVWRIARRLVARNDVGSLLRGLERLKVVSIGLGRHDDPQQIFESLNATGKPLTESEKVKNWLLMGLPDAEQQVMHDEHWLAIERALGAERSTEPIDIFLRDLLRWRTGEVHGIDQVYENFRRWVVRMRLVDDRPALCEDLANLAKLYGRLSGTAGAHPNRAVRSELQHLQAMGIDTHRPFTLRLLHDAAQSEPTEESNEELAKTLAAVNTWIARLWLADQQTAGMNRAIADLAHEPGPGEGESLSEHWIDRIQRRRNTRVGVPSDEQVAEGIRSRKAYGGSASQAAFAVLCSLMEAEHKEESPARERLTLEHVMPQKLTDEWREALGGDAEEFHGRYRDRLANLTLSGDVTNAGLGAKPFEEKKQTYRKSTIGITRRLASESQWNEGAIERRAQYLSERAIHRWPWAALETRDERPRNQATPLRWRIDEEEWRDETAASQMVLNVAGALLTRDPANAQRLSGESVSTNIHPASRYPAGSKVGALDMRAVPRHEEYVLYPYAQDYRESADRCRKMGRRCDVAVEVEFEQDSRTQTFWRTVKTLTGGVPGQKDSWRGRSQWTPRLNDVGDRIVLYVGHEDRIWMYVRAGEREASPARAARMREISWMVQDQMSDEILGNDLGVRRIWRTVSDKIRARPGECREFTMSDPFKPVDRDTPYLLPPSLQDWLPQEHLARFVVEIVDRLDLSELERAYRGRGKTPYHPSVMVALLFYGYATGVFSSRKLEQATYDSVAFRYITADTHPDHDTIAHFRKRFLEPLRGVFVQILVIAQAMGVLKIGTVSLDGTKVKANASKHKAMSWGYANRLEAQLREEVQTLLEQAARADTEASPGLDIPEELERREARLAAIERAKAEIERRAQERYEAEQAEYEEKLKRRRDTEKATGKKARGREPKAPVAGPLSANMTETPAPLGITVGRWR